MTRDFKYYFKRLISAFFFFVYGTVISQQPHLNLNQNFCWIGLQSADGTFTQNSGKQMWQFLWLNLIFRFTSFVSHISCAHACMCDVTISIYNICQLISLALILVAKILFAHFSEQFFLPYARRSRNPPFWFLSMTVLFKELSYIFSTLQTGKNRLNGCFFYLQYFQFLQTTLF